MSHRSSAYKNVLSLQLSRILGKVFNVLFLAVAARYLGTGRFGQWVLIFLFVGFFGLIADFGMDRLTVRDVARNLALSKKYLSNTLVFKFLSLFPAMGLLVGTVYLAHYPQETINLFMIALPLLFLGVITSPFSSIIQAHEKIYILSAVDICMGLLNSSVGIALLFLGYGIQGLLIMFTSFAVVRFMVLFIITRRLLGGIWYPVEFHFIRSLLGLAFPFAVLSILALIHWKVDHFMISKMLGDVQLGLYAAAYKIFENVVMVGITVNAALYPSISALFAESKEKLRRVYENMQRYFIIVSLPISAVIFMFAREIILLMYGDQYLESVSVLILLSFGFSVFFFSIPMRLIINNSELIKKIVPYSAVTTSLNIIFNYIVIPRDGFIGGITGAALVSIFVGCIDVMVRIHFIRRIFHEGYHPLRLSWRPLIAASVMVSVIYMLSSVGHVLAVAVGLSAYGYILKLMGELGVREYRMFIREPVGKILSFIGYQ